MCNLSRRLTWAGIAKRVFDVMAIVTSRKTDEEMFSSAVGDAIFWSLCSRSSSQVWCCFVVNSGYKVETL